MSTATAASDNTSPTANRGTDFSAEIQSALSTRESAGGKVTSLETIFQRASEKYGVPLNLLKAVAKEESGFHSDAVSSCGAQGIMQLMPSTAKSLGVTNAFDPEQNIMGGAKLLGRLLTKYDGNTDLALAAYSAGTGAVAKYGGVPPYEETQNAIKKVMKYLNEGVTVPDTPLTTNSSASSPVYTASMLSANDSSSSNNTLRLLQFLTAQMQFQALSGFYHSNSSDLFGGLDNGSSMGGNLNSALLGKETNSLFGDLLGQNDTQTDSSSVSEYLNLLGNGMSTDSLETLIAMSSLSSSKENKEE